MAYDRDGNRVFQLNYNLHTDDDWKANSGNGNGSNKDNSGASDSSSNSSSTNSTSNGSGNTTNAEDNTSQNQSGILYPVDSEVSDTEQRLIDLIKTTGKQKNYALIEYINDVNRKYTEVLVEQNINGKTDTSYVYGVDRLSLDRFDGSTGYYLYDPRGSVVGITNEEGQLYQSYRYGAYGEITFGAPQYENEYTYNGESYNPNIESQYLRARYYYVVSATFLSEDSYLGNIVEPLTLNRYVYCVASPPNYNDPSGHAITVLVGFAGGAIVGFVGSVVSEVVTAIEQGDDYDLWKGLTNVGNTTVAGAVSGAVFGATGNVVLAGMAGGAVYGGLDGLTSSLASGASAGTTASNVLTGTGNGAIFGGFAGSVASTVGPVILGVMPNLVGVGLTGVTASTLTGELSRMVNGQSGTNEDFLKDAIFGFGNAIFGAQVYSILQGNQPNGNSNRSLKDAIAEAEKMIRAVSCLEAGETSLADAMPVQDATRYNHNLQYTTAGMTAEEYNHYLNGFIKGEGEKTQQTLQKFANDINANTPGNGPVVGTNKHTQFKAKVDALGNTNLATEKTYLNGRVVSYGTKGGVRVDVIETLPDGIINVYDLKTGSATLTPDRITQIQNAVNPLNPDSVNVIQIK